MKRSGLTMGIVLSFTGAARADDGLAAVSARVAQEPGNGALLLRRASLHRKNGDLEAALADLELAAALPGGGALAAVRAGLLLADAGRHREAVERFDVALARKPGHFEARNGKATSLWHLGARAEAAAIFEGLLGGDGDPETFERYAELLSASGRPGAAVEVLDRGLARFGAIPTLTLPAIELEVGLGRWEAALHHLDTLLAVATRRDYLLMRRGDILARAGRRCEALESYREALTALDALAEELTRLKSSGEARSGLEERLRRGRALRCGEALKDRPSPRRGSSPRKGGRGW